jgi:hypothetical protein
MVKPDPETLSTVPEDPPEAGPERALDPPLPGACGPDVAEADAAVVVVAVPEPVLAVALTMPEAPPPMAMAEAPMAMALVILRVNIV